MVYKGSHKLGDLFNSRREKGRAGLPTLSVTLNNGLVDRETLERKTDTNLLENEHLLVKKGDIAYNMMRMWQGASGRSEKDGLVSPAYIVLAPKQSVDSVFASYLFKSQRLIYLFWAYSYGLTSDRLRLYFSDFSRIPVDIPIIKEQMKIAKILSTWDKAIETTEKLIENSKAQKKALMQQLLTGKKRFSGFKSKWRSYSLSKLGVTYAGLKGKTKEDFGMGENFIPYINIFNNSRINVKSFQLVNVPYNEKQNEVKYGDIFFTTSSETPNEVGMSSVLLDKINGTYLNSFCFGFRLNDFDTLLPEYASYLFRGRDFRQKLYKLAQGTTRYNLSKKELLKVEVLLPSLEEQMKIYSCIDAAQSDIESLISFLGFLQAEKKALMQQLLTGKRRVKLEATDHFPDVRKMVGLEGE